MSRFDVDARDRIGIFRYVMGYQALDPDAASWLRTLKVDDIREPWSGPPNMAHAQ